VDGVDPRSSPNCCYGVQSLTQTQCKMSNVNGVRRRRWARPSQGQSDTICPTGCCRLLRAVWSSAPPSQWQYEFIAGSRQPKGHPRARWEGGELQRMSRRAVLSGVLILQSCDLGSTQCRQAGQERQPLLSSPISSQRPQRAAECPFVLVMCTGRCLEITRRDRATCRWMDDATSCTFLAALRRKGGRRNAGCASR
jgi:hypothetical protein